MARCGNLEQVVHIYLSIYLYFYFSIHYMTHVLFLRTDEMLVKGMGQLSFEWIGGVGGRPGRRRVPCRIENFCGTHKGWRDFATGALASVSTFVPVSQYFCTSRGSWEM